MEYIPISPVPNISTLGILIRQGKSSRNAHLGSPERICQNSLDWPFAWHITISLEQETLNFQEFPAFPSRGLWDEVNMLGSGDQYPALPQGCVVAFWSEGLEAVVGIAVFGAHPGVSRRCDLQSLRFRVAIWASKVWARTKINITYTSFCAGWCPAQTETLNGTQVMLVGSLKGGHHKGWYVQPL